MAKLTLYHAAPSRSSITRWMLEEIGEPYDLHLLSLMKGEQREPDYLAVNPMGKVPALKHGDVTITEAAAICTYLADEFPKAGLNIPIGDPRRGIYLKWLFFGPSCLEAAMLDRAFPAPGRRAGERARLRQLRHRHERGGESGGEGPVSHGREVHRRRRGGGIDAALGHDVQDHSGAAGIHRLRRRGCRSGRRCNGPPRRTRSWRPPERPPLHFIGRLRTHPVTKPCVAHRRGARRAARARGPSRTRASAPSTPWCSTASCSRAARRGKCAPRRSCMRAGTAR